MNIIRLFTAFFFLFSSVSSASLVDEVKKLYASLIMEYPNGGCHPNRIDELYNLYWRAFEENGTISTASLNRMAERLSQLRSGDPQRFAAEYRDRATRQHADRERMSQARQQSVYPFPMTQSVARVQPEDPFAVQYSDEEIANRIIADFDAAKKSKAKAAKAKSQSFVLLLRNWASSNSGVADLVAHESTDILESQAAEILFDWLKSLVSSYMKKNADSEEKDADQVREFILRYQAVARFAATARQSGLTVRLNALRQELSNSEVVRTKLTRARSVAFRGLSLPPSALDSRQTSFVGSARGRSDFSHRSYERALSRTQEQAAAIANYDGQNVQVIAEDNSGNGDCTFLALGTTRADFIQQVRNALEGQTNERAAEVFANAMAARHVRDIDAWTQAMNTRLWGGDLEINLFGIINNVRIVVFTEQNGHYVQLGTGHVLGDLDAVTEIWVARVNENHYIRLRRPVEPTITLIQFNKKDDRDPPPGGAAGASFGGGTGKRGRTSTGTAGSASPSGRPSTKGARTEAKAHQSMLDVAMPSLLKAVGFLGAPVILGRLRGISSVTN